MKRIGIAASKISKGNQALYNVCVILISVLFSLFIFVVAGSTVIFALSIVKHIGNEVIGLEIEKNWKPIITACMVSLTVVITVFSLMAVLINIKPPKPIE